MFTGIVEATGTVRAVERDADGTRLRIGTDLSGLAHGDSVSVAGVCLTVERSGAEWFEAFLAAETRDRTALDDLAVGDAVNLERAMAADDRFDGHLVQGHVDGCGSVARIESAGEDWTFAFAVPDDLTGYVAEKGSIAVDGISLTVADVTAEGFAAAIVPTTYERTTLSEKAVGDPVHLEVDPVARYVERLLAERGQFD